MDPRIARRYSDLIFETALERFGIDSGRVHALDGFESFLYEYERRDEGFVLRIGHSLRRSRELIHGEVDWINYLARGGARVARAILSENGNLVEAVEDGQGGQFLCTAFVRAAGSEMRPERLNERLVRNYGRLLGRMHTLAKAYQLSSPAWKRPDWDDPSNLYAEQWMPGRYHHLLPPYQQLVAQFRSLPRTPEGFGMIHQDAHPGNFFVDPEDQLTLFDFDDCVYGHFIYDIAMVLFYTAGFEPDPSGFLNWSAPAFLGGYREENRLDPLWLQELPGFLKLREIDLFAEILYADGENPEQPWSARYMQGRRERIERGVPFIDFDWDCLADYL